MAMQGGDAGIMILCTSKFKVYYLYTMYPPRRTGDSSSKPKSGYVAPSYSSPPHKDISKVNKILENAKKYEQVKDHKRDYMLEGIMNLKKKSQEETTHNKRRRESELSNNSGKAEDHKQDIYTLPEGPHVAGLPLHQPDQRTPTTKLPENSVREIKRNLTGNHQQSDSLPNPTNLEGSSPRDQGNAANPTQRSPWNSYNQGSREDTATGARNHAYQSDLQSNNKQQKSQLRQPQLPSHKYETNTVLYSTQQPQQYGVPQSHQPLTRVTSDPSLNWKKQQPTGAYTRQLSTQNLVKANTNQMGKSVYSSEQMVVENPKLYQGQYEKQRGKQQMQKEAKNNPTVEQEEKQSILQHPDKRTSQIRRVGEGEVEGEQKNYIKAQMDRLSQEAIDMRNRFYKAQEGRTAMNQKCRLLEKETHSVRAENEQLKLKLKNMQFELSSLKSSKALSDNRLEQLQNNKQSVYDDLMAKMNQLTVELRKKSIEIANLERTRSELEAKLSQSNYENNRMKEAVYKRQQEALALQDKLDRHNKFNSTQGRAESQVRQYTERISALEAENGLLREQKGSSLRLETQISKYRKQIQEMLEDMKDLEAQLEAKDRIIQEYRLMPYQQNENRSAALAQQELEVVMKQRSQEMKDYEQKLLEKDRKISELEIKKYESPGREAKLSGMEAGEAAFEQILRQQLEEINSLKRENASKISQLFNAKIELENVRSELQNEMNKMKILTLQLESKDRNQSSVGDSHLRAARNEIESLQRRVQSMNRTIEAKRKQNQNKDQFIKQYLIGVNKQGDTGVLLSKLEVLLGGRQ